jgi:CRISPR-associated protein Csb2
MRFAAGRYHATPWGRHVNEGVAEWPPSPYRLLRALYDVWQRKCFDLPREDVDAVLQELATGAPQFVLPPAVATHARFYLSANSQDPTDKNLVFDPFLVFAQEHACYVSWPDITLPPSMRQVLDRLLNHLNYLGRSESWVEAELWNGIIEASYNCVPAATAQFGGELTRVACAAPASEYSGKSAWLDALTFSTADLLKEKVSSPPLLKRLDYVCSVNAIQNNSLRQARRMPDEVRCVLLGLDAKVLPLATTTLEVSEQIRVRLMGAHKSRMNSPHEVSDLFSGKRVDGQKRLDHGHVYILPLGNMDGRIDRVLIVSRLRSFLEHELDAVRGVRKLWQREDRGEVQCVVTWQGRFDQFRERKMTRVAESATPFVPPRHWRKGRNFATFLMDEVRRECRNHGIDAEVQVDPMDRLPGLFHEVEYRRNRKDDPVRPGYALRLTFDRDVPTPFAIGYGAHFGLGQFRSTGE